MIRSSQQANHPSSRGRRDRLGVIDNRRANFRRRRLGQPNDDSAAPAQHVLGGNRAAVRDGDAPRDRQAQPNPGVAELPGRLGAIKRLEYVWEVFG
jgi:hypothetical protein